MDHEMLLVGDDKNVLEVAAERINGY